MTDEEKKARQREHEKRYEAKDPERRRKQKRESVARWRAKNLEAARAANKACDAARKARDPEAYRAKARAAGKRQRRAKGIQAKTRMPEEERKQKARSATKRWAQDNREYILQFWRDRSAEYRRANPNKSLAAIRAWKLANPERARQLQLKAKHKRRAILAGQGDLSIDSDEWEAKVELFGGKCAYCLEPACELDHIDPIARGGLNLIENAVPACRRCNSSKHAKPLLLWLLASPVAQSAVQNIPKDL